MRRTTGDATQLLAPIDCGASEHLVASLEDERRRNGEVYPLVIRVNAPSLGLSRKLIDVSMKPKVRHIVERFFCSTTPRSRMRFLALPASGADDAPPSDREAATECDADADAHASVPLPNARGTCVTEDVTTDGQHVTYLYEVGAGIGEMRLDPDANMWDVYLRNPLAEWIVK